jgi:hypothetical protein
MTKWERLRGTILIGGVLVGYCSVIFYVATAVVLGL